MSSLLNIIFLLPILGVFAVSVIPDNQKSLLKKMTIVVTGTQLILAIILYTFFEKSSPITSWNQAFQYVTYRPWIFLDMGLVQKFKVTYYIGVDGISMPLVLLSAFILFVGAIFSHEIKKQVKGYHALYLLLSSSIIGCFVALDFFLFYLCFEFMLLPMFFLIGIWGGARRSYASIKFLLYTLLGSLLILVVMIGLYLSVSEEGNYTFNILRMIEGSYIEGAIFSPDNSLLIGGLSPRTWAFMLLLLGFIIKLPAVPFHTWLPDAHVEAPTPISIVLAGLLLKIGAYGLFRIAYSIFPDVAIEYSFWVAFLGILSIIYGGMNALAQTDLKKMVAYSSISHMGFVLLGLASFTFEGISGALFHLISHGLISSGLFIIVGILYIRTKHRMIDDYSGLGNKMPLYTVFVCILFFAGLGLPGMAGFVGELMVLIGTFKSLFLGKWMGIVATFGIVISAAYFIWTLQRMFFGNFFVRKKEWETTLNDLTLREKTVLVMLSLIIIWLGIYPKYILDSSNQTIIFFVDYLKSFAP